MKIAIDFDSTVVKQEHAYDDLDSPLEFIEGAREGLLALKAAGHILLLWSGRASRALLLDPSLNPLVRAGVVPENRSAWEKSRALHQARYEQMILFVETYLPGVFDAIDDGLGGKPLVDLFIDDKSFVMRGRGTWSRLARTYGEPQGLAVSDAELPESLLDRQVASLDLTPTGPLLEIFNTVRAELKRAGIVHFDPTFALGDSGFWCADRSVTINIPWWLASEELSEAAQARFPHTWDDVLRGVRHEVGHALNYAFELWRRPDWTKTFGDFLLPYPKATGDWKVVPNSPDFVAYVQDSGPGYAQKHPDEDWAETFATWLDPSSDWRNRYRAGARRKLEYVHIIVRDVLTGWPTNNKPGVPKLWRAAYAGQTVAQALAIPTESKEASNG